MVICSIPNIRHPNWIILDLWVNLCAKYPNQGRRAQAQAAQAQVAQAVQVAQVAPDPADGQTKAVWTWCMVHIWFTYCFFTNLYNKKDEIGTTAMEDGFRYWYVVGLGVAIFNSSMLNLSIWPPSHIDRDCPRPGSSWKSTILVTSRRLKSLCSFSKPHAPYV